MIDNWIPLFSQVLDSTLWEEAPDVRLTFLTMLILKGPDQVVRMPMRRLAKKVNLCEETRENELRVQAALKVLEAPDNKSTELQEYEGRRIEVRREGGAEVGWLILNGEHYQEDVMRMMARARKTAKQRERREAMRKGANGSTAAERLMERAQTPEDVARIQELADKVPPGLYGSKGPEAQEVVRAKVDAGGQDSVSDDMPDPDTV